MKKILLLFCCACLFNACKKTTTSLASNSNGNSDTLISITGDTDSSTNFFYYYNNNQVTDIYTFYKNSPDSVHYAHLDYTDDSYIKVTDPLNELRYTEYFLTNLKLPLTIIKHSDVLNEVETINFYYKPGTNFLDSISDNLTQGYYKMHYEFDYEGQNVSDVLVTQSYSGGSGTSSLHYTYDISTQNIFRRTDSLLYILTDPFATQISNTYIPQGFFANVFSAFTFNNLDFVGDPYNYLYTLKYNLNINGTISSLGYNNGIVYSYK